jgi:Fe-S cluster biogenesis protein NfuA
MQGAGGSSYGDPAVIIEQLNKFVNNDGAAFELVEVNAAKRAVLLKLVLDGVECLDCVMPRHYLEQLSLTMLRETLPDLQRVVIDDPREHVGAAPSGSAAH